MLIFSSLTLRCVNAATPEAITSPSPKMIGTLMYILLPAVSNSSSRCIPRSNCPSVWRRNSRQWGLARGGFLNKRVKNNSLAYFFPLHRPSQNWIIHRSAATPTLIIDVLPRGLCLKDQMSLFFSYSLTFFPSADVCTRRCWRWLCCPGVNSNNYSLLEQRDTYSFRLLTETLEPARKKK